MRVPLWGVTPGDAPFSCRLKIKETISHRTECVTERDSAAKLPLVPQPEWFEAPVTMTGAAGADIDKDGEPDPGLAGSWDCTFEGPMGKSNMKLLLEVDSLMGSAKRAGRCGCPGRGLSTAPRAKQLVCITRGQRRSRSREYPREQAARRGGSGCRGSA